jgi:fatty aldehyde-generating acyl-ACP reductase
VNRFGFVLHPLEARRDVARKYPFARALPTFVLEALLGRMKPKVLSTITGVRSETGAETAGCFVGCPVTPGMLMRMRPERAYAKIVEAVEMAASAGAQVVGLGAFTAVVGDAGRSVAKLASVPVTTGNSYTVATAIEGSLRAAEMMGIDPAGAKLAVVGATGSIGRTCAELLAPRFGRTVLVGRDLGRTQEVLAALQPNGASGASASVDVAAGVQDADVVVTVTSAASPVIEPEYLKSGAVVCDVARPRDVSRRVAEERDDVLVVEGGVVAVPGQVDFGFDFGFPPGMAYACMAETMVLALEGRLESYTVGKRVSVQQVEEISSMARKHGFRLAGFRSFEKAVSEDDVRRVAAKAGRRVAR